MSFPESVLAQENNNNRPLQGLVWTPPADTELALANLLRFSNANVQALRTPVIQVDTLFALADSLEISFFQDLSSYRWTARELSDSLHVLEAELDQALTRIEEYESARDIGLATLSDTSTERACEPLAHLASRARDAAESVQLYYVTQFLDHNPCSDTVDLLLLDVRDQDNPGSYVQMWLEDGTGDLTYGIGALGTWADTTARPGLHVPHSFEYQARYLENHLGHFLGDQPTLSERLPEVLFVYRWNASLRSTDGYVPGKFIPRSYALSSAEREYPGWDVVRGWFTGEQRVFAFQAGEEPSGSINWLVVMAWFVIIVLGVYYLADLKFKRMVKRYFGSRSFYRDAVREGRNVLMGPSLLLLVANGVSLGIIIVAFGQALQEIELFSTIVTRLPSATTEQFVMLLTQPVLFILLIAGVYALVMCVWAGAMSILSGNGFPLGFDQVLMLVAWPRWPVILLMIIAVTVSTSQAEQAFLYLCVTVLVWLLVVTYALFRTVTDYIQLARLGAGSFTVIVLGSPAFLFLLIGTFLLLEYRADAVFIWHLASRT